MFHFCKLPLRTTASEFHQDRVQAKYPGALKEGAGSVMDTRNTKHLPRADHLGPQGFSLQTHHNTSQYSDDGNIFLAYLSPA